MNYVNNIDNKHKIENRDKNRTNFNDYLINKNDIEITNKYENNDTRQEKESNIN